MDGASRRGYRESGAEPEIGAVKRSDAMQPKPGSWPAMLTDKRERDLRGPGIEQTPDRGRASMAEHGVTSIQQNGRCLLAKRFGRGAIDEVDAPIPSAEPTGL